MKTSLSRNVFANVLQTLASTGLLFSLYRYINTTLGIQQLGVWSVVLATVSASRLADLGLSAGVTRFVARDLARGDHERVSEVIDTTALTLMVSVGAILPLAYPLIARVLPHLFEAADLRQALEILPYALVSLWLTIAAAVYQGSLEGCQRMDLRAGLVVAGQVLLLALALCLVPGHGLVGLAWAQLGQGLFLALNGRFLLSRVLSHVSWFPRRWRKSVLLEMLGYGANVQAATLFMLLFDPITKALMARFGGATAAGYFEMANQVVLKLRAVIVYANQAVVPKIAEVMERTPERLREFYRDNMRILVFVALPVFALLTVWSGGVSWLLLGRVEPQFLVLLHMTTGAWFLNLFSAPAYFANRGSGHVGWNTVSHIAMGAINAVLGWWLGHRYGAAGVAWAYVAALVVGSWLLIVVYQRNAGIHVKDMGLDGSGWLAASSLIAVLVANWVWTGGIWVGKDALLPYSALTLLSLLVAAAAWSHPLRGKVWQRIGPRVMGALS